MADYNNGTVTVTVSGGTPDFVYTLLTGTGTEIPNGGPLSAWPNFVNNVSSSSSTFTFGDASDTTGSYGLSAGTYKVRITDANGCVTESDNVVVGGFNPSPTATPVPTATATPVPTATATPVPTATATPEPTATEVPPTPTATATATPTATPTPEPTATEVPPTATPEPTATEVPPTPTATETPTPTVSPTPTATRWAGAMYNLTVSTPQINEGGVEEVVFQIESYDNTWTPNGTTVGYTLTGDWAQDDIQVIGADLSNGQISEPFPVIVAPSNPYSNIFKVGTDGRAAITITANSDGIIENLENIILTLDAQDSEGNDTDSLSASSSIIDSPTPTATATPVPTPTATATPTATPVPVSNDIYWFHLGGGGYPGTQELLDDSGTFYLSDNSTSSSTPKFESIFADMLANPNAYGTVSTQAGLSDGDVLVYPAASANYYWLVVPTALPLPDFTQEYKLSIDGAPDDICSQKGTFDYNGTNYTMYKLNTTLQTSGINLTYNA